MQLFLHNEIIKSEHDNAREVNVTYHAITADQVASLGLLCVFHAFISFIYFSSHFNFYLGSTAIITHCYNFLLLFVDNNMLFGNDNYISHQKITVKSLVTEQ